MTAGMDYQHQTVLNLEKDSTHSLQACFRSVPVQRPSLPVFGGAQHCSASQHLHLQGQVNRQSGEGQRCRVWLTRGVAERPEIMYLERQSLRVRQKSTPDFYAVRARPWIPVKRASGQVDLCALTLQDGGVWPGGEGAHHQDGGSLSLLGKEGKRDPSVMLRNRQLHLFRS